MNLVNSGCVLQNTPQALAFIFFYGVSDILIVNDLYGAGKVLQWLVILMTLSSIIHHKLCRRRRSKLVRGGVKRFTERYHQQNLYGLQNKESLCQLIVINLLFFTSSNKLVTYAIIRSVITEQF